jgi:hypothetical protein
MLKKVISHIAKNESKQSEVNFFDLSSREKEKIIKKAAELSAQDQKNLLKEYERKFGDIRTDSCK